MAALFDVTKSSCDRHLYVIQRANNAVMKTLSLIAAFDVRVLLWWLERRHFTRLISLARGISRSGDGYLQASVPVLAWSTGHPAGREFALHCIVLFAIERCLYWSLKNSLRRPRPPASIPAFVALTHAADEFSFPSGHTSAAVLLAMLVYTVLPSVGLLLFAWATLVGVSRVVLGVHYPTDVLAGVALGIGVASLAPLDILAQTGGPADVTIQPDCHGCVVESVASNDQPGTLRSVP